MLCPNCSKELTKDKRHGEGVWQCKNCESIWFIINIRKTKKVINEKSM